MHVLTSAWLWKDKWIKLSPGEFFRILFSCSCGQEASGGEGERQEGAEPGRPSTPARPLPPVTRSMPLRAVARAPMPACSQPLCPQLLPQSWKRLQGPRGGERAHWGMPGHPDSHPLAPWGLWDGVGVGAGRAIRRGTGGEALGPREQLGEGAPRAVSFLKDQWQPTPVSLPGESPCTEEPVGLQSMGWQRVGHNWVTNTHTHIHTSQASGWLRSGWGEGRTQKPQDQAARCPFLLH